VKSNELANLCADTIGELAEAAEDGLDRICGDASLCFGFLRHTGLRYDPTQPAITRGSLSSVWVVSGRAGLPYGE
jgi:hypothetical protein